MFYRIVLLLAIMFNLSSFAAGTTANTSEATVDSNRMKNRLGAYLGLLGDPFPTIIGVNVAYNIFDFMRATGGFGQVSASASFGGAEVSAKATTFGLGTRFFVPGWSLSPVGGLSFAAVSVSGSGVSVNNFSDSGSHVYATLGADWQAASGFNVGVGYNISFKSGIGGMPYINLGWFFDVI
jgi:hypothetical protein